MYPNLALPRAPSEVITDRLAARAQPPIGVPSDSGGLRFDSDVMGRIIRIVSGNRTDICFLAQAHPYFFRETDPARVHAYFKSRDSLLWNCGAVEFNARFTAMLLAMRAAGDRLSMNDRLSFLTGFAYRVMVDFDEESSLRLNLLRKLFDARHAPALDMQSKAGLLMFIATGYPSLPAHQVDERPLSPASIGIAKLLEADAALPELESNALALLSTVMAIGSGADEQVAPALVASTLARIAGWPQSWQCAMLCGLAFKLTAFPASVQVGLATRLFEEMGKLPGELGRTVFCGLMMFMQKSLLFRESDFKCMLLKQLPAWLACCNTLAGAELANLISLAGSALAHIEHDAEFDGFVVPVDEIGTLAEALVDLSMTIPLERRSGIALLSLISEIRYTDPAKRTRVFGKVWDGVASQEGLSYCLHQVLCTMSKQFVHTPEITGFLLEQLARLPDIEKTILALSLPVSALPGLLRPDVADAILAHLPGIPSATFPDAIAGLFLPLGLTSAPRFYPSPQLFDDEVRFLLPRPLAEALAPQASAAISPAAGGGLAGREKIVKKIVDCLPPLGGAALDEFLRRAKFFLGPGLTLLVHACLLDSAESFPPASKKIIARYVLAKVLDVAAHEPVIDVTFNQHALRAFHFACRLPAPSKADILCVACRGVKAIDGPKPAWDRLIGMLVAEIATLPMQDRGRVLDALAGMEDLSLPQGAQKRDLFLKQAALLDPHTSQAWTILIELRSVNPLGGRPEVEHARFLELRSRCERIEDAVQIAAVMSRMDELAFVFRQKGYPEGGRIHWKRSVDSTQ